MNIEEATEVIWNHDFSEAQMILQPPPGNGDVTDEEDINEKYLFDHTKEVLPEDVSGEVEILISNVRDIASISLNNETSGEDRDIDFDNHGEYHSDDDSDGVEIAPDKEIHSSNSDFDDDILLGDLVRDAVAKGRRKTRSTRNEAKLKNEILDDVLHVVERKCYDIDIEEKIFDTEESTNETKNEKPPTKKKIFDVSDIQT